jgi:hypothetical protein
VAANQGGDEAETACHEALQTLVSEYYRRTNSADWQQNAAENRWHGLAPG